MPSADFFKQFGLIAFRGFLARDFCRELCDEISRASLQKGFFRNLETGEDLVDEKQKKRSETIRLDKGFSERISQSLREIIPEVEGQFNVSLNGVQQPKFCLYEKGDFYGMHVDSSDRKHVDKDAEQREISAIIFLNEESQIPKEGAYSGGNLTFYGLMENDNFGKFGLPLVGETGMLITFPPTLLHEVTKVTEGKRFTIATWFV